MATLEHDLDLLASAKARLPEQFKNLPDFGALLAILVARSQGIENTYFDLYQNRWISTAIGAQLDNLGLIVGQAREWRDDTQYRIWIQARIAVNRSNGRGDELLNILSLINGGLSGVRLERIYPAAFRIIVDEVADVTTAASYFGILDAARGVAVHLFLEFATPPATGVFSFASGDVIETDADLGFADDGGTVGGEWAGVLG